MLVSIVTIYYNRSNVVEESINSLLTQSHKDLEIIAIDDGSTDGTYEKLLSINDERLNVIKQRNMGFVKSLKKAISISKGDYIAIHGSGDISSTKRIEKQAETLEKQPDIGVVSCYTKNINMVTGDQKIVSPEIPNERNLTDVIKDGNPFNHGCMMFRKKTYEDVGGYRDFFKYTQDRDLWLRMSLETKFYQVPETLYIRYNLPDGVSNKPFKVFMQYYFGEISNQCIDQRRNNEQDIVDLYGFYAPFFKKRSKRLSKKLQKQSLSYLLRDDLESALLFIDFAINEKKSLNNIILKAFLHLINRVAFLKKFSSTLLKNIKN